MKKISLALVSGILAASMLFTACGSTPSGNAADDTSPAENASVADDTSEAENTSAAENNSSAAISFKVGYPASNSDVIIGLDGVAVREGYFDEEFAKYGATFEAIPFAKAGPAINTALASKELDGAIMMGDVPSAIAKAQGNDTVLIDMQPKDFGTHLIVRSDLGITDVKDLKGKSVAVQTSSYMMRILYQILEENGLSSDDVEIINMSQSDAASAIVAGSIDATVSSEVGALRLEQEDSVSLLFDAEPYPEMAPLGTTLVRTEYAKEHPELLKAYFTALFRAKEYVEENPDVLRTLYIEAGNNEAIIDMAYADLSDYASNVGTTDESKAIMQTVIDFLKDNELISNDLDLDSWYDSSYYEAALAEYN